MPYVASRVFEREDDETSRGVVKAFKGYFVIHLESKLKECVGSAHLEFAKKPKPEPYTSTGSDLQQPSGPTRNRSPRAKESCYEGAADILQANPNIDPRTFSMKMDSVS
jgi:hypothetical protein